MGIRIVNVIGIDAETIEELMDIKVESLGRKLRKKKLYAEAHDTGPTAVKQMRTTFEESRRDWEQRRDEDRRNEQIYAELNARMA